MSFPGPADAELLQAIRAAPDDIAPRQVLADLLSARGDPRGAFIDAQCRLAGRGLSPATRRRLRAKVRALLAEHADTWVAPARAMDARWEFRRGFLFKLTGDIDRVLEHWQPLFASEPVVHVEVENATPESMARVADSGMLAALRYFTVRGEIGDDGARALAGADITGIERLNLKDAGIADDGLAALAAASGFRPRRLTLTGNPITDRGAEILADSPILDELECLFLSRTLLGDAGVTALAGSPRLSRLRDLALGALEELTDEGVQALIDSPHLPALRYVEVNACWELSQGALDALDERFERVKA